MRSLARLALASAAVLSLAGCSDRNSLVEPLRAPASSLLIPPHGPKANPEDFIAITAGGDFVCARKMNGNLYCWGRDDHYQTGAATSAKCAGVTICVNKPKQVMKGSGGPLLVNLIDAGARHACALESSGTAWCWGDGNQGQVANTAGSYGDFYPAPVTTPASGATLTFSSISAGSNSSCGTTATAAIYCWGTVINQASQPTLFDSNPAFRYSGVSVGDVHVCAMDVMSTYGTPRCKGNNLSAQGGQAASAQIAPTQATTFGSWVGSIATEGYFTCVNQVGGTILTVQCVGSNVYGTLGNGLSGVANNTGTAQTVGGGSLSLHGVTTGSVHACAIDDTNRALCWGNGFWGQLGNGNASGWMIDTAAQHVFTTPQLVSGGHTFRALAAGNQHTCGIGTDNVIYCWGSDMAGQLGQGNPTGGLTTQPLALAPIP